MAGWLTDWLAGRQAGRLNIPSLMTYIGWSCRVKKPFNATSFMFVQKKIVAMGIYDIFNSSTPAPDADGESSSSSAAAKLPVVANGSKMIGT